jgi:hypothetical protein
MRTTASGIIGPGFCLVIGRASCPFSASFPSFLMAKIEVNQVAEILKKHKLEPALLREIVQEMNEFTQPAADEDIKPPAPKKQFVVLLSDPEGKLPKKDLTGWVVQIPENASPFSTTDRIFKGAYDFNASKKGRLLPVKSVGEALESASAKYFKESELWVKTKMPVAVVVTDNVLPKDEFKVEKIDKRRRDESDEE